MTSFTNLAIVAAAAFAAPLLLGLVPSLRCRLLFPVTALVLLRGTGETVPQAESSPSRSASQPA